MRIVASLMATKTVLALKLGQFMHDYPDITLEVTMSTENRHGSTGLYRWEFEKGGRPVTVAVREPLVVDDAELLARGERAAPG